MNKQNSDLNLTSVQMSAIDMCMTLAKAMRDKTSCELVSIDTTLHEASKMLAEALSSFKDGLPVTAKQKALKGLNLLH